MMMMMMMLCKQWNNDNALWVTSSLSILTAVKQQISHLQHVILSALVLLVQLVVPPAFTSCVHVRAKDW